MELYGPVDPRVSNPTMYEKIDSELEKVAHESQEEPKKYNNEDITKINETVEKKKPYVPPPPYKPKI